MSFRYYLTLFKRSCDDILDLLRLESELSASNIPKEWAKVYLRCIQIVKLQDNVHRHTTQPQLRRLVASALEACTGHLLELHQSMVAANAGYELIDFIPLLEQLDLTPDDLEINVPWIFTAGRAKQLAIHDGLVRDAIIAQQAAACLQEEALEQNETPPLENGVAGAAAVEAPPAIKDHDSIADKGLDATLKYKAHSDSVHGVHADRYTPEVAAVKIQTVAKGWLSRHQTAELRKKEEAFLGMSDDPERHSSDFGKTFGTESTPTEADVEVKEAEYQTYLADVRSRLWATEALAIKLDAQSQVNAWIDSNIDTDISVLLPTDGQTQVGGVPEGKASAAPRGALPAAALLTSKPAAAAGPRGTASRRGSKAPNPAGILQAKAIPSFLLSSTNSSPAATTFTEALQRTVEVFTATWAPRLELRHRDQNSLLDLIEDKPQLQGLPQPCRGNSIDEFDEQLAVELVRVSIQSDIYRDVKEEANKLAKELQAARAATAPSPPATKAKGEKNEGAKQPGGRSVGRQGGDEKAKGPVGSKAGAKKGPSPPKDLLADRDMSSILSELACQGLARPCPSTPLFTAYLGSWGTHHSAAEQAVKMGLAKQMGPRGGKAKERGGGPKKEAARDCPALSMAQTRLMAAVCCALPLATKTLHSKVSRPTTLLLYGHPGTGKTTLATAIATESGATLFDLSPATTFGKYPGKDAGLMVDMVFRAAKATAPAVIYIDEIEKIFIADKTRAGTLVPPGAEPHCRVKKKLLEEVAQLTSDDCVLVIATSSQPQACVMSDEEELVGFAHKLVEVPLPDELSRQHLLRNFINQAAAHGKNMEWEGMDIDALVVDIAAATGDYTPAQLKEIVDRVISLATAKGVAAANQEVMRALEECKGVAREQIIELREWSNKAHAFKAGQRRAGQSVQVSEKA